MSSIIEWPESQHCILCKHAVFVMSSEHPSAYVCEKDHIPEDEGCNKDRVEVSEEEWQEKF